jgi:glycosyltransferase involved in cell wall biosynthesis
MGSPLKAPPTGAKATKVIKLFAQHGKRMITFTVPTYNEGKYIGRCLDSLFRQNGKTEAIVVDSYSTDATVKIAEDYGAKVIFDKFGSTGRARDKAMRKGKGSILISCSADAVYPEGWLERITGLIFEKRADAVMGSLFIDQPNFIEHVGGHLINRIVLPATSALNMVYANADNIAIERDFYRKIGGFPHVTTGEDTMLVRAAREHGRMVYSKEAFALTSPRRMRKWGYIRYTLFHARNFIDANLFSRTRDSYEPIR